ncbi:transcriptional regulator [Actinotalea sp. M2MS4P-6]|uniref:transcriptional regulator n=1 Tax=Actinotalea sp. M2MS4P-6 TaxID=2983762 RepID=UPI0021E482B2|nr:transcriptional regulator [Actinotalea sp. M2MS4P-6]MCV2395239.1 transcriptional regulator [Actinotalea sp. M2MS4P-6]
MRRNTTLPTLDPLVHEPARLRVLAVLAMVESADFMFLLRQAELSRGNLSVQMTRLEEANLVVATKNVVAGRVRTSYRLTDAGLAALRTYRSAMREILAAIP